VGNAEALFQPMYISRKTFYARLEEMPCDGAGVISDHLPLNFLPGPVSIRTNVRLALSASPVSHRSEGFINRLQRIKSRLNELTGARYAEVLLGSGTLANDAIAWQLKQLDNPGLVLTSGEFGDRLVDHARRAGLDIQVITMSATDFTGSDSVNEILARYPDTKWLWTVHCETSTGAMIDLATIRSICKQRGVKLCVDAISTFGVMPLNLRDVYFASAVSGKAVGSYPGLAIVFYSHQLETTQYGIPRYLDLNAYAAHNGVPYTHSSNLVEALDEALKSYPSATSFEKLTHRAEWLRGELAKMGCELVSDNENTSPAVVTISLPGDINSRDFGDRLADNGCLLSYQSDYLLARNRVQICMMSHVKMKNLQELLGQMQSNLNLLH
jgi:aspartate aminotransferase-like enzyme